MCFSRDITVIQCVRYRVVTAAIVSQVFVCVCVCVARANIC